jgi:competence ComEA-like helix-hairpin-helix protein
MQCTVTAAAAVFWVLLVYRIDCVSETTGQIDSTRFSVVRPDDGGAGELPGVENAASVSVRDEDSADAAQSGPSPCINVNTSDAAALEQLPGIGPVLAARIVEYRTANGRYRKPADLINVKGIGSVKLEKIKPHICF